MQLKRGVTVRVAAKGKTYFSRTTDEDGLANLPAVDDGSAINVTVIADGYGQRNKQISSYSGELVQIAFPRAPVRPAVRLHCPEIDTAQVGDTLPGSYHKQGTTGTREVYGSSGVWTP